MSRPVHACHAGEPLSRAAQIMWENDCGWVPVVDADGRPMGVVTDRDVCMAAYTQGRALDGIEVQRIMSTELVTCGPEDTLRDAEERMRHQRVRRLPVLEEGQLIGVLSLNDIALAEHERGVSPEEIAETLAAICAHRATLASLPEAAA